MATVLWLTDDLALEAEVEQAAAFAEAELHIATSVEYLPRTPVDVILWWPTTNDKETYLALTKHCHQVIQMVKRGWHQDRLCPFRSEGAPRYYVVVPFNPEELGTIICHIVRRARKRKGGDRPEAG
ncbi:MAG: hypothetical protein GFH27_549283n32 [Chloroflexi bacterium AL-W]|nr:hypothetical protein [Chloroflexi bacterium AL-N1]NOK64848.1 hypothetical protein [Chloroflexi bacterium AL-N10]NOK76618.1 hypothetical protein [Chloroflexi bacterium AL-N5]NOK80153.1 hypothetical protein [Chloroflexi bacterium AL-W]NOK86666.1 hypothetical protein [Chloroflexi bacterium AL-N15]